ncbi:MAG TPA: TIGR04283 family arsenosugar biosynthesis glycosyltransferase [Allosphingosinicella sp.]
MLSIIVPTLNAASTLEDCLSRLSGARDVIVVDGGSWDGTQGIAASAGARLVMTEPGRGAQLRLGAEAARGDWLLFLHADTLLEPGWLDAVRAHVETAPEASACFRFRLDARAWQARLIEAGVALRVWVLGLPYGDQGLLVPRALYDRVGGYADVPLMEDVDLIRRIGRFRLRILQADALTSAARWRRDGWFRRSARNLSCLLLHRFGMSEERLARLYE